jgi:hypothetical protein
LQLVANNSISSGLNAKTTELRQSQFVIIALGLVALTIGTLVYVLDRPSTAVYFVPDSSLLAQNTPLLFGLLGNYLPAFMHAMAFVLFSIVFAGKRHLWLMAAAWFVAELLFELSQLDVVATWIATSVPTWFAGAPILENIPSHFLTGRFDSMDVLFLLLGCASASAIGYLMLPQPNKGSRRVRLTGLLFVAFVGLTSIVSSGGTGII